MSNPPENQQAGTSGAGTNTAVTAREMEVREREVKVKEDALLISWTELVLKRDELELQKQNPPVRPRWWESPLVLAIIAGMITVLANIVSEYLKATHELELKQREQQFEIVQKATGDRTPEQAARNLLFFVDIGYLPDPGGLIRKKASARDVPVLATGVGTNPIDTLSSDPLPSRPPPGTMFSIWRGLLYDSTGKHVAIASTPTFGPALDPKLILVHASDDTSAAGVIAMETISQFKASHHLVIGRDGKVTQMVPFTIATAHAGRSEWNGVSGLDSVAIGIQMISAGHLRRTARGWTDTTGAVIPAAQVVMVRDRATGRTEAWQSFTPTQISALEVVCRALKLAYPTIQAIEPHSGVSQDGKHDPGPAFPLDAVRSAARLSGGR